MKKKLPSELTPDFVERSAFLLIQKTGMTRSEFDQLDAKLKSRAFTVAYIESVVYINKIQKILEDAILNGKTLKQFKQEVADYLHSHPWHIETVLRTNVQSAYGAARWEIAQQLRSLRPYGWYNAVMDGRTRPAHAELHGKVYPLDHPFWQTFWPPWDYNCRCHVRLLSEADLQRNQLTPEVTMPAFAPTNDFVSPAVRGVELPAEELLPKIKELTLEAQLAIQSRLHEEIAFMERQVAPRLDATIPSELGTPPSREYWKPIEHELPEKPTKKAAEWTPAKSQKEANQWVQGSSYTSDLYIGAKKSYITVWKKEGLSSLMPDDDMLFGKGIYLSEKPPSLASGEVCKVKVRVSNPYTIQWDGTKTNSLTSRRGPLGPQLEVELLNNPGMTRAEAVTNILKRMGHDGVVYHNTASGEKYVVVFDKQQAVIVKGKAAIPKSKAKQADFLVFTDEGESDSWAKKANYGKWTSDQLTHDERYALEQYKGSAYTSINLLLRTGNIGSDIYFTEEQTLEFIKHIDTALNKHPLPKNLLLYRGTSYKFFEGMATTREELPRLVGQVFEDKGYPSCSIVKQKAWGFRGVILEIRTPKGTSAGYLESIWDRRENEILLCRGLKFKIVSVDINATHPVVTVDIID